MSACARSQNRISPQRCWLRYVASRLHCTGATARLNLRRTVASSRALLSRDSTGYADAHRPIPSRRAATMHRFLLAAFAVLSLSAIAASAEPIKTLIVDGQNNHSWRTTTPILKKILDDAKMFQVDVATAPEKPRPPQKPKDPTNAEAQKKYEDQLAVFKQADAKYRAEFASFRPKFADYAVVVSNYN